MPAFRTIIEPFRIKSVEPIRMTSEAERHKLIKEAHNNLFLLKARDVMIDLLTDSGTSAMSAAQWSALQMGDESYAGSRSYHRFIDAVHELMPFKHIIPTHQGRAAERILMSIIGGEGKIIPNNTHFDTTRANVEFTGAKALDLVIEEGRDPLSTHPFKGNIDLNKLEQLLASHAEYIPLIMLTLTNNAGGGQPVSLENIKATKALCEQYKKPLFIDGCRFAENAYFIQQREKGYRGTPVKTIVQEIFSFADGMTMSAKKDGLANIGGWLALNDDNWAEEGRSLLVLTEGFPTYGGLAGRDLEAIAVGLKEVIDEEYLCYRIRSTEYLANALCKLDVPIVKPAGGHAVFIDAKSMLPHIDPLAYPGQSLAIALFEAGGIRAVEIGTLMFGQQADGTEKPAVNELVRLALPRRVYTQSHIDYVIEVIAKVNAEKHALKGYQITWQPKVLRHFTAHLAPLGY